MTNQKAKRLGLNRRTLYASTLHSWPINASHLETGAEALCCVKSVLSRLRPFYASYRGHFTLKVTAGVVSERYPRGGALMLNAIAGVGMISVGTIGNPGIGTVQDMTVVAELRAADPALAQRLIVARP